MVGDRLHMVICQMMQGGEFFACYRGPDGGVVALDRQGVRVQV
jgi:ribosomal protein L21E